MKKAFVFLAVLFLSFVNAQDKSEKTFKESPLVLKINVVEIFGTLTTPNNLTKRVPVALIISGSGPTDRDGNNPMMKNNSLKMLSEALAKNGIATLRYDK
ncbi:alpha/beta hydrolase, partial [Flavobacterium sp. HMWF030]